MKHTKDLLQHIQNKKMLVIFPHPDDEAVMAAGLIQQALHYNWQVKVVCVTNGALGQIHIHGEGRSVVQIRRDEMKQAMTFLKVKNYNMLGFCDGKLKDEHNWPDKIEELIQHYNPGLVVTYGPCGISGHPDHLSLGKKVFDILTKSKPHTLLWWPAFVGKAKKQIVSQQVIARHPKADIKLKLSPLAAVKKYLAMTAHQSQALGKDLPIPLWLACFIYPFEYFAQANLNKKYDFDCIDFDLGE